MFDLQYPIFQAAPGGPALAIAVAGSGAMGAIDLWWRTPEDVRQVVSMLLAETQGKFYANYVLHNFNPEARRRSRSRLSQRTVLMGTTW